jgi:hypothetical protein
MLPGATRGSQALANENCSTIIIAISYKLAHVSFHEGSKLKRRISSARATNRLKVELISGQVMTFVADSDFRIICIQRKNIQVYVTYIDWYMTSFIMIEMVEYFWAKLRSKCDILSRASIVMGCYSRSTAKTPNVNDLSNRINVFQLHCSSDCVSLYVLPWSLTRTAPHRFP